MLHHITNITGITKLSKKEQQRFKAGAANATYRCPGTTIIVNATCPATHPYMHPQGHCICCSTRWQKIANTAATV